jgi:hypothetical protein
MKTIDLIKKYWSVLGMAIVISGWIWSAGVKSTKYEAIENKLKKLDTIEKTLNQVKTDQKITESILDLLIKMRENEK